MFEWLNSDLGGGLDWGTALSAGAGLLGTYMQYQGQKKGAAQIAEALGRSEEEIQQIIDQQFEAQKPMIEARNQATQELLPLLGLGTPEAQQAAQQKITGSQSYQTALGEALKAADTSATVPGGAGLRSSNQAVARAAIAPTLMQSEIDRKLAGLGGLIGMGQTASNVASSGALTAGSQLASTLAQQGLTAGQNTAARYNTIGQGLGGLGGMILARNSF